MEKQLGLLWMAVIITFFISFMALCGVVTSGKKDAVKFNTDMIIMLNKCIGTSDSYTALQDCKDAEIRNYMNLKYDL